MSGSPTAAVIAPNWLGDAVMALPAIRAFRAAHPEYAVAVYARPAVAGVFPLVGLDLRVETLPQPPSLLVQPAHADLTLIFPNSFYSALLALRLAARGAPRIGYRRDGRGWLLRPAIAPPAPGDIPSIVGRHESFYYLELLRRAGLISTLPPEDASALRVPLVPDAAAVAAWRLKLPEGPRVAMHVGATFGTAKRWLPERFSELARRLVQRGATVMLIGSRAERALALQVAAAGGGAGIQVLAGETSLASLVALLAAVDALVANDSGPMHLAAGVGTPVVALFGSTNERETYPLAMAGKLTLLKVPGIECSPCKRRECPIDHRCMTRLEVTAVAEAVEKLPCFAHLNA